ncbi:hypothetical protein E2K80_02640 [Rhodophyticola sp. CCM32]|uniref:hypothetical protein n=1 Tax=Rhodophyticola sp. CCM32 TaxID=2916397 RepID=UPI00107FB178|nr:hypothetical protein [Rhodophyticola sp. CCM32]QBX99756.1 hypothetical protein E2K80_02640 [Rhodophyticola sp. CCM32]
MGRETLPPIAIPLPGDLPPVWGGFYLLFNLMLVLVPFLACVFAVLNLRVTPEQKAQFAFAVISSGLTGLTTSWVIYLPRAVPATLRSENILEFTLVFLWAWTLLDFWRGTKATGWRPRLAAIAVALSVISLPVIMALLWLLAP